ncbi:unnamed protein product [Chilo suppressalis]|uniref:Amino acid transporter transmembrane domain-containing protein n=1 Tax=Chilo suppressalis TaxID=168631 RepID=A0ABN8L5F9_CHISP|nr:unnamed protein product [Chilo suppressalis]
MNSAIGRSQVLRFYIKMFSGGNKPSSSAKDDDVSSLYSIKILSDFLDRSDSSLYHEVYPGTERAEYDFTLERRNVNGTNLLESTSHIVKGCLGVGILSMHVGYMHGGLWASLGVTAVIGSLVPYAMYMLVYSAQKLYVRLRVPRLTYSHLVEAAIATGPMRCCRKHSKVFRYSMDVILFSEVCGTCCIYQIMIASTMKQVLESLSPTILGWHLSLRIYILIVMVPFFCMSMITNLKYLAPFSLIADLFVGMTIVLLSVTLTGFFGYWGYGEKCRSPIITHMPFETVPIILGFLFLAALIVSFAINFWVPFRIIWHYIGRRHKRKHGVWERIYRGILVIIITCLSLAYPNLIRLMILMGNFFLSITTFIVPALIESLVTWRPRGQGSVRWRLLKNTLLITFGLALCICTLMYFDK